MIHNNNTDLFDDLQRNLSKLVDTIIYHPYIHALEKKQISKDKLEIFVCEQFQIIVNDKRNFAFMISDTKLYRKQTFYRLSEYRIEIS